MVSSSGPQLMFTSVLRESSLSGRAESQIETLILEGQLRPGDRLPSEKELGARLGVSKTVIREAIRSLAAKGLVEVRAGSGTYVLDLGQEIVARPLSLLLRSHALEPQHIHEVREVLEVRIARLAAERAQPSDLEAMEQAINRLKKPRLGALEYAEADVAFHTALARASGNILFSVLAESLNGVMKEVRLWAFRHDGIAAAERAVVYHSNILERVRARESEGAAAAMLEHLGDAEATLGRVVRDGTINGAGPRDRNSQTE
jgi:GntR family transcriptional repressor for pyruvate dehydrogenase complex